MTGRADINMQIAAVGRTGLEGIAATTAYGYFAIFRMYFCFHYCLLLASGGDSKSKASALQISVFNLDAWRSAPGAGHKPAKPLSQ